MSILGFLQRSFGIVIVLFLSDTWLSELLLESSICCGSIRTALGQPHVTLVVMPFGLPDRELPELELLQFDLFLLLSVHLLTTEKLLNIP